MLETSFPQRLLALFTSPECAEAIAGDFEEARGGRGPAWFWRQIFTTAMALCGSALTRAPLASLGLAAAGCVLFGSLAFTGVAPVAMFPALLGTPASWIVLSVFWWSGAFFAGFTLVSLSPARGAAASVLLAMLWAAWLMVLRLAGVDGEALLIPNGVFYSIATISAVSLVSGAANARRRIIDARSAAALPQ